MFIGEIVSKAGVFTVKKLLSRLKEEKNLDFVIAMEMVLQADSVWE